MTDSLQHVGFMPLKKTVIGVLDNNSRIGCFEVARVRNSSRIMNNLQGRWSAQLVWAGLRYPDYQEWHLSGTWEVKEPDSRNTNYMQS